MKGKSMFGLGCLKDPVDRRDIPMKLVLPRITAPPEVDYGGRMSPVRDQGPEGTCVAFAAAVGVKEYQEKKERGRLTELSPRYLYSRCKKIDGIPQEEGTYPRTAMKVLAKTGVCLEECWPYRSYQKNQPCSEADAQAGDFRIRTYARLSGIPEMERSLSANGPFLVGVEVFPGWFDSRGGMIPLPDKQEIAAGGHAICVAGYDRGNQVFKFKNSWGAGWGDRGYGYLPYEYMRRYCLDAWSATDLVADTELLRKYRKQK
jgi:C1A family cysteine protease